ncbi:MAG: 4Fe-4S dicluster domain-containing protein [Elusimicrobia bacterium]|nr:4Fe-4S dicluster domain-containing protein [Elusimicrobiota bacterium]
MEPIEKLSRRSFLKRGAAAGAGLAALAAAPAQGAREAPLSPERKGVLVDTTTCISCRNCEWACKTAHDLPTPPLKAYEDKTPLSSMRRPDATALTVVNRYDNLKEPGVPYGVKVQCMHCEHPACVSACIVGALTKQRASGAVVWDTRKCIGCRYCMVACPFQVPAFEYRRALQPRLMKCDFCFSRQEQGKVPACVEKCPVEALTFGPREDLVRVARERVKASPERYINHVYGELEVGGTSWLYLAGRDFADLQFPKLAEEPPLGVTESIQEGVFAYFVPPVALFALLGMVMWVAKNRPEAEET